MVLTQLFRFFFLLVCVGCQVLEAQTGVSCHTSAGRAAGALSCRALSPAPHGLCLMTSADPGALGLLAPVVLGWMEH